MERPASDNAIDFKHPPAFMAAVALAALKGEHTVSRLAERYAVTEDEVRRWRDELTDKAAYAFDRPADAPADHAALLDTKALALTIAENSTQGLAMMDERGYCIYANRAWLSMTGYSTEEIRSRPLHELVHHHYPDGRPYPMQECPIDRALPERFDVRAHEDLFFRKDGSAFPVSCAASPIFESGRPVATVIEIRDITEQRQAAERERQAAQAATAMAETNAKFRTFFEQGSYFAGLMTLDGTVVEANRLCLEASGFSREEIIGRKFWECGWWNRSPDLVDMVRNGTEQAAAGRLFSCETIYFIADGSERIVDLMLTPVTDENGRVLFIAPTGVDITERKRVEGRLRLLDATSEATRAARDARTIMDATTRLLGEYLGATRCAYADLEPDNDRFTIRHDWRTGEVPSTVGVYSLNLFGSRAATALRAGKTLVVNDVDRELARDDGADMFNAIGIKAVICTPLVKEGRLVAMMAVHQAEPRPWRADEVSLVEEVVERSWAHIERVRATDALRRSEAHLQSLFEQTAAGFAESDTSGRILSVNERYCRILKRTPEELVGRRMQEFTHPEDLAFNLPQFDAMLRTGESFEIEKRYLLPDGSYVWANTAVSLIRGAGQGSDDIVLAVVLDITERKRAEQKLKDADRRKDEFLAMLAHELRNPLAPIGAAAELLRLARLDEQRLKQISEIISRQVGHMTGLIDDLLDVSRVTRGLVSLDMIELDVRRVVAEAVEQARPAIEARRHQLIVQPPREAAFVRADRKRVVQIMVNLLNNAAKYTPDGGRIAFGVDLDDACVTFTVKDNGIGMSAELVSHAFELFTQAERSSDRSQGGLGIGLALVKSLAELHGGSVRAFSDGVGHGSAFSVSLPRWTTPSAYATTDASDTDAAASAKLNIMVVDDNVDAAQMLALFLESLGHRVSVEHDALRALERTRAAPPDVYLLDIGLPGMDGNELARCLRAQTATARAVLIAVTGYGREQDRAAAMRAGFDYHFVKPVDVARLAALLRQVSNDIRSPSA